MSSGANPAILIFPTGTDIYSTKVDQGTVISGESHLIPASSPYQFYTNHVPLYNNGIAGSTISVPGYTEQIGGTPGAVNYVVVYSGNSAGLFTFSNFAGGNTVSVTYTAAGDEIVAEWFNSLQTSVTGIEAYLLSGNATAVQVTGGSMTGNLTMNGGSVMTSVSGTNQVGSIGIPFSNIVSNEVTTNEVTSFNTNDTILLGNGLTASGNGSAILVSDTAVIVSGGNTASIIGMVSGVFITAGNSLITMQGTTVPTGSYSFDLGSPSQRWRTAYVNSIDAISSAYVPVTGGTMTGPLTMAPGQAINTDFIDNASSSLSITSSNNINLNAPLGNMNVNSNFAGINNNLGVGSNFITVNSNVSPTISGLYDIGTIANPFNHVYANSIIGASIQGSFVHITGDTMTGDLSINTELHTNNITSLGPTGLISIFAGNINITAENNIMFGTGPSGATQMFEIGLAANYTSADIVPNLSGLWSLGAPAQYYKAVYANNIFAQTLGSGTSMDGLNVGLINVTGTIVLGSGIAIISSQSGTVNIGTSGNPIGTIYANTIVTNGTTGNFISKYGDNVIGTLVFGTGAQITYSSSGINTIGSSGAPLGTLYVNNIVSSGMSGEYVPITGGSMIGPLTVSNILSTGNMSVTSPGNLTISGNNIYENGESINLLSTNGPIMLNANTELQVSINSVPSFAVNTSGIQSFANAFPNISGTLSLGTPMNPWAAVYANSFIGVNATGGAFVLKAGDTMAGNLTFNSGVGVAFNTSGTSNIGSPSDPANAIYANNIVFTSPTNAFVHVTGDTMTGSLSISSGGLYANNLYVYTIGNTFNIGSGSSNVIIDANPGDNAYISVPSGASIKINDPSYSINLLGSGITTSGNIIPVMSGIGSLGTIASPYGSLNVGTANISSTLTANAVIPSGSGIGTIGTLANPYSNIVTKSIDGILVTISVYNEIPSGLVNGSNSTFTTAFLPVSGTQRLFRAGLRMSPNGIDYNMSGNTILFNIAPINGDNLNIDYKRLP